MLGFATDDKYTKPDYNRSTGKMDRQWIRYSDDTFVPVRKDGDIRKKYHSKNRFADWSLVNRSQGWDPTEHGFDVSLNHDYGQHDNPAGKPTPRPMTKAKPKGRPEPAGLAKPGKGDARTMEYRYMDGPGKAVPEVQKG